MVGARISEETEENRGTGLEKDSPAGKHSVKQGRSKRTCKRNDICVAKGHASELVRLSW